MGWILNAEQTTTHESPIYEPCPVQELELLRLGSLSFDRRLSNLYKWHPSQEQKHKKEIKNNE